MGRAFRVVKRTAHLTVEVTERAGEGLRRGRRVGTEAAARRQAEERGPKSAGAKKTGGRDREGVSVGADC